MSAGTLRRTSDYARALAQLKEAARLALAGGFHDILADVAISYEVAEWRWGRHVGQGTLDFLSDVLEETAPIDGSRPCACDGRACEARLYAGQCEAASVGEAKRPACWATASAIAASFEVMFDFGFAERPHMQQALEMTRLAEQVGDLEISSRGWFQCLCLPHDARRGQAGRRAGREFRMLAERIRQPVFTLIAYEALKCVCDSRRSELAQAEELIGQAMHMRSPVANEHVGRSGGADVRTAASTGSVGGTAP